MPVREKKHRLSLDNYLGFNAVSFTCCLSNRKLLFVELSTFAAFEEILLDALNRNNCGAHVYLFMPDHGHLILQGKKENSNTWKCMVAFKRKSGYWLSKNKPDLKWQKDFYDHVLRKDEDIIKQVKYVLHNPVRKGLVENWKESPYKGSTIHDFGSWD
jgi:putative transposase